MALPGAIERPSHGAPAYFAPKQFVQLWPTGHHDHQFAHLWCAAPPGAQEALVGSNPKRFFRPPYVGGRGWIGVRLDGRVDWVEVETLCEEAYRTVGPHPDPVKSQPVPGGVVHELPADLREALITNSTALKAWKDITPLARNEFICWVEDAKQATTRERRIRRTREELEEGQRRPCCWPGCRHRERTGR